MKSIGIIGAGKLGKTIHTIASQEWDRIRGIDQAVLADNGSCPNRLDVHNTARLQEFVRSYDGIVSALPAPLNSIVANACLREGRSYFDFAEDMDLLRDLRNAGSSKDATFVPQCGFSPGIVNTLVGSIVSQFESIRQLDIRVGAVPVTMTNQMKYYSSWNTSALVAAYIEPADALHRGMPIKRLPLDGLETVVLGGVEYEAFTVGGGSAALCETLSGLAQSLTYKALRYPGHCQHMRFLLRDLDLQSRPGLLTEVMNNGMPAAEKDIAVIFISVYGLHETEYCLKTYLKTITPYNTYSAIQLATAGSMAAILELWATGKLPRGVISHEAIPLHDYSLTRWGSVLLGRDG